MATAPPHEVIELLVDWRNGDHAAVDRLMPLVDRELHRPAHHYTRQENPVHTLRTTALVNEAYPRLFDQKRTHWKNPTHFFALSAQLMRRILVDHARKRQYAKRGGDAHRAFLEEACADDDSLRKQVEALLAAPEELAALLRDQPLRSRHSPWQMIKTTRLRWNGRAVSALNHPNSSESR